MSQHLFPPLPHRDACIVSPFSACLIFPLAVVERRDHRSPSRKGAGDIKASPFWMCISPFFLAPPFLFPLCDMLCIPPLPWAASSRVVSQSLLCRSECCSLSYDPPALPYILMSPSRTISVFFYILLIFVWSWSYRFFFEDKKGTLPKYARTLWTLSGVGSISVRRPSGVFGLAASVRQLRSPVLV